MDEGMTLPSNRRPSHPGEILKKDFFEKLSITQQQFADQIGISRVRLSEILNEKRGITPDTAWKLADALNTTPEVWMNLQTGYDLWKARNS